jgi:hypothetical protein
MEGFSTNSAHASRTDSQLEDLSVVTQRIWGFLRIEGVVTMAVLVEEVLVTRHAPANGARIGVHRSCGTCGTWTWWGHERRNQESIAHILVCVDINLSAERVVNGRRNVCLRRNIILSPEGLATPRGTGVTLTLVVAGNNVEANCYKRSLWSKAIESVLKKKQLSLYSSCTRHQLSSKELDHRFHICQDFPL